MHDKSEVSSFNRFGAISIDRSTGHTHRRTSNENSISAIHSVHVAEIIIIIIVIIIIIIIIIINFPSSSTSFSPYPALQCSGIAGLIHRGRR